VGNISNLNLSNDLNGRQHWLQKLDFTNNFDIIMQNN